MKIKLSTRDIYYFFVILAFFFPRGFSEYSSQYHMLSTILVFLAIGLILIQQIKDIKHISIHYKWENLFISIYFVTGIAITFAVKGTLSGGLQQLFAVPALCIFLINNLKKAPQKILNVISTILVIDYTLNIILTKILFGVDEHIIFLGHVQVVSQLGIVTLFVACLYLLMFHNKKIKMGYLVVITLFTMFTTDADSALFSAIILLGVFIAYKWKLYHLFCFKTYVYLIGMYILNITVIYFTAVNRTIIQNLNFSGRIFVWQDALLNIKNSPIIGYGMDGVLLHTFWTEWSGGGFNYAHNQILQNMLDGGFFLTIAFAGMLFAFIYRFNKVQIRQYKILVNATLIALFFIMIFDSTTIYCYMYIVLSIVYALPDLLDEKKHVLQEKYEENYKDGYIQQIEI